MQILILLDLGQNCVQNEKRNCQIILLSCSMDVIFEISCFFISWWCINDLFTILMTLQTEKFKSSVESLENTFVSATKSHEYDWIFSIVFFNLLTFFASKLCGVNDHESTKGAITRGRRSNWPPFIGRIFKIFCFPVV